MLLTDPPIIREGVSEWGERNTDEDGEVDDEEEWKEQN